MESENVLQKSIVMRRILKLEDKNRVLTRAMVEKELVDFIDYNGMDVSKTVNIALEKYLTEKGFNPEKPLELPR